MTTAGARWLAALATTLTVAAAAADDFVLPPAVAARFQAFATAVKADGTLGRGVAIGALAIERDRVRLTITGPASDEKLELVLANRADEPEAPHSEHFALLATDPRWGQRAATLAALSAQLDATFGADDPWIELPPAAPGRAGWRPSAHVAGLELPRAYPLVSLAVLALLVIMTTLVVAHAPRAGRREQARGSADRPATPPGDRHGVATPARPACHPAPWS